MTRLRRFTITGILFVLTAGSLAHFFYEWSGNQFVIGLFSPVSESVWEHMKLVFFPMLLYSSVMYFSLKKEYPCITSALSFGIILGTFLVPFFFYSYTLLTGHDVFLLDIATFALSILIAFFSVYRLALSCMAAPFRFPLSVIVCVIFLCFLLFTCYPPDYHLFADPAAS